MANPYKVTNQFKKYNKLQSLRTMVKEMNKHDRFKKYNKLQSLRTIEHRFTDRNSSKNTTNYNP